MKFYSFVIKPAFLFSVLLVFLIHNQEAGINQLGNQKTYIRSDPCVNEEISVGRSYFNANIEIDNCFFKRNNYYEGKGGIIFIDNEKFIMYIENCVFTLCFATDDGGAINCLCSHSTLNRVCAYNCRSQSFHFGIIANTGQSIISFLSMAKCSNLTENVGSLRLFSGNHSLDHLNSSLNKAENHPSIGILSTDCFNTRFCTFCYNEAKSECFYFLFSHGNISFCNIIHNICPKSGVLTCNRGTCTMDYCVYNSNFYLLFQTYQGSFKVSNSYISHDGDLTEGKIDIDYNNSFSVHESYMFEFYQTYLCSTDIISTPESTCSPSIIVLPTRTNGDKPDYSNDWPMILSIIFAFLVLCAFIIFYSLNKKEYASLNKQPMLDSENQKTELDSKNNENNPYSF